MAKDNLPAKPSSSRDIDAFLGRAAKLPTLRDVKGRLIFAIDATMSRQPTWNRATEIQSDMFQVAQGIGGLAVQLVYFRGHGEFRASDWTVSASGLANRMRDVTTRAGFTQLRRVLAHAVEEAGQHKIGALVYVGDCFEEDRDQAAQEAARLALLGVPAFMFQEGEDPTAGEVFSMIARLTKGVHARFDSGAAKQLRELLMAAAIYATGGAVALREHAQKKGGEVLRLFNAMGRK
ncbi:MAG: VWA domain-containing protein [Alphaproteobacteria bacterium]|nr:VWA domain-containing protein [Alphaproteobacteria bacterium]